MKSVVRTATALPKGYTGRFWTTVSSSLGTVFHYYGRASDE